MRQIIFTPAAEADLYDALDWYAQNATRQDDGRPSYRS
jgi:plasmid stabilization system protein ParE